MFDRNMINNPSEEELAGGLILYVGLFHHLRIVEAITIRVVAETRVHYRRIVYKRLYEGAPPSGCPEYYFIYLKQSQVRQSDIRMTDFCSYCIKPMSGGEDESPCSLFISFSIFFPRKVLDPPPPPFPAPSSQMLP